MELFFQDVGKDSAWEDGGVVLPLPRRQLQPEERQEHFPRAQGISFRASPNSEMCPIFTASSLLFICIHQRIKSQIFPKYLTHSLTQKTAFLSTCNSTQ